MAVVPRPRPGQGRSGLAGCTGRPSSANGTPAEGHRWRAVRSGVLDADLGRARGCEGSSAADRPPGPTPIKPEDTAALAAYRSEPAVARYQSWSPPVTSTDAVRLVTEFAAGEPHVAGWFQYSISRRSDGLLLADLGVRLHDDLQTAELGITVASAHQSRGYATEAASAVVERLFSQRGLHKVSAECDARNTASAALLRRLGFQQEGLRRQHTWVKGEWTDDLLFGLLSTDRRPGLPE